MLREKQLALETEYDAAEVSQYLTKRAEDLAEGKVHHDPRVHNIIRAMYQKVYEYLLEHVHDAPNKGGAGWKYMEVLRAVPTEKLTAVAIVQVLRACLKCNPDSRVSVQHLCLAIGQAVVTELRIAQAGEVNPIYMQKVHDDLDKRDAASIHFRRAVYSKVYDNIMQGEVSLEFSTAAMIHIGKLPLHAIYEAGLIYDRRSFDARGSVVDYDLTPEVREYITDQTDQSVARNVFSPMYRRMVCKPDPWVFNRGGGYLSDRRKCAYALVTIRGMHPDMRHAYEQRFNKWDMPKVFQVANYLQSIPFTDHKPTIDLMRDVWADGNGLLGVPRKEAPNKPVFPFPDDWDSKSCEDEVELQKFRQWKLRMSEWYTARKKLRGHQIEVYTILRAESEETDKHYFPVYMDSRGRWYYRAAPNPQGADISRAVVQFHKKKPLGERGLYWLKVHIANCLGFDKARFDKRVEYVDSNWERLRAAVESPMDYADVFGQDAPMSAYTACYELYQAYMLDDPTQYETGIPVHMDATVSGTQHFSALLRDEFGGRFANLVDTHGDEKADLYTAVADAVMDAMKGDVNCETHGETAKLWLSLGVPRDLAKRPVMTFFYGVSLYTVQNYVLEWLDEEYPAIARQATHAQTMYLARKLFEGIGRTIPSAVAGMEFLSNVARAVGSEKPIEWTNPETGMPVHHAYYKSKDRRIKIHSAGMVITTVREYTDTLRGRSMVSALAPNFVHSLDAAHLSMVALEFDRLGLQMVGIHDSIGTHPADVDTLHRVIREQFVKLYQHDHLQLLKDATGADVELPARGTLDLDSVLESEFFFC